MTYSLFLWHTLWHTLAHWHAHKWKVGLLPSKVRLLSKVLLEALSLLASYVLVNASSLPARGDDTEESRAESQPARREVTRPGRSKVAFISSDRSCAKESLRRTSWRPRGVLQLPREDTERAESRRGDASEPSSPSAPLADARKGRRPAGARLVLLLSLIHISEPTRPY